MRLLRDSSQMPNYNSTHCVNGTSGRSILSRRSTHVIGETNFLYRQWSQVKRKRPTTCEWWGVAIATMYIQMSDVLGKMMWKYMSHPTHVGAQTVGSFADTVSYRAINYHSMGTLGCLRNWWLRLATITPKECTRTVWDGITNAHRMYWQTDVLRAVGITLYSHTNTINPINYCIIVCCTLSAILRK